MTIWDDDLPEWEPISYVVPWSGEFGGAGEGGGGTGTLEQPTPIDYYGSPGGQGPVPPVEIPGTIDMSPFELFFNEAIPEQGVPVEINQGQVFSWVQLETWVEKTAHEDIRKWVTAQGGNPDEASGLQVENFIKSYLRPMANAWNSYVNILADSLFNYATSTNLGLYENAVITNAIGQRVDILHDRAIRYADQVGLRAAQYAQKLFQAEREATNREILQAAAVQRQWVMDNVFVPLAKELQAEHARAQAEEKRIVHTDIPAQVQAAIAPLLAPIASIAAIKSAVGVLQKESNDCVKPMCSTMGPNTNLGKLLKAIDAAALLAIVAELAGKDFKGIEDLIRVLANKAGQVIDTFDTLFVEGGDTLAETIGKL